MKKLFGLIVIIGFLSSCAHNKIRFGQKMKFDKNENSSVNIEDSEEEFIELKEVNDHDSDERNIRTTDSYSEVSEDVRLVKSFKYISQSKLDKKIETIKSIQIKGRSMNELINNKEVNQEKRKATGLGIGLVFVSLILLIILMLITLLIINWNWIYIDLTGFLIPFLVLLFVGVITMLIIGIVIIVKGNKQKGVMTEEPEN